MLTQYKKKKKNVLVVCVLVSSALIKLRDDNALPVNVKSLHITANPIFEMNTFVENGVFWFTMQSMTKQVTDQDLNKQNLHPLHIQLLTLKAANSILSIQLFTCC